MPDPVVITRPALQAAPLAERVSALGHEAVVFPLLDIQALPDQSALQAALADVSGYAIVAFVSPNAIAAAQKDSKIVYVDFTARWCATCQTNKGVIFHNDAVLATLSKNRVVLLRGDWTNRDAKITAELARWNRSAVPFNLLYSPGSPDPIILPELLTPSIVSDALTKAGAK